MEYRSGSVRSVSGSQIREDFLRFFEGKVSAATGQGHRRVHSSSLVPANDPTLLFTNAGMNQFKDVFLGAEKRDYSRATTSQKCVRAGGKHNDLENVGFTRRHHTFFEMLGNFSFGDYFKRDAIAYAWEFLTSAEWCGIDPAKLYVTIFEGDAKVPRDAEAEQIWIETGVPKERIFGFGAKDNFWQMGETGPCGPCSEIFYDFGVEAGEDPSVDKPFGEDDQRYVEIWNLVFMQFDRAGDGTLTPLPKPSIDTGMGLERIACVLQGVLSNFDTDLFAPLIRRAAELTGQPIPPNCHSERSEESPHFGAATTLDDKRTASLRIIADHARCATFLISDGVIPANEGRGYVLRKIMRRGIRHGRLLGQEKPFLFEMVFAVRDEMGEAYPELKETAERVAKVVKAEEEQFARTLEIGSKELDSLVYEATLIRWKDIAELRGRTMTRQHNLDFQQLFQPNGPLFGLEADGHNASKVSDFVNAAKSHNISGKFSSFIRELERRQRIAGRDAFRLYETFGMPLDFMVDAARDAGIAFDMEGFDRAKEEEQARARASWKGGSQKTAAPV